MPGIGCLEEFYIVSPGCSDTRLDEARLRPVLQLSAADPKDRYDIARSKLPDGTRHRLSAHPPDAQTQQ